MRKPVRLRGHHLLCILTYKGKGYTPDFVKNFDAVVAAINDGEKIQIVDGSDDICAALRHGAEITCAHARECRTTGIRNRDRMALREISRILQFPLLKHGDILILKKGEIKEMRHKFQHNAIRRACVACGLSLIHI